MKVKFSQTELFVISKFIEDGMNQNIKTKLNEDGVEVLARIYAKIGSELLGINLKDILKKTEKRFLESINFTDKQIGNLPKTDFDLITKKIV